MFKMESHALLLFFLTVGVNSQLNPLGRFGKCIDVPTVEECKEESTWYLQYRPDNPDHYVHTCQAQFEKRVNDYYSSLLYFYNKGKMVNNPQNIKYRPVKVGQWLRKITVDDVTAVIYANVIHYDAEKKYRVMYLCSDCEHANPDIFNVEIATVDQCPENLEEVLSEGQAKLKATCDKFDVPLMKVEQSLDKCEPLDVSKESTTPCETSTDTTQVTDTTDVKSCDCRV